MKMKKSYYIGLDIGTDSVGYAVSDTTYNHIKYKGEPMWGVTTFDKANENVDRRMHRTARRRLDRRQTRVDLLEDIFAKEIGKLDPRFFIRLQESGLYRSDVSDKNDKYIFFNDDGYNDSNYFNEYPTIHHLICELMKSDAPHDIRLVYLACAWLVGHRGHFLSDISKENADYINDFSNVYRSFEKHFEGRYNLPWKCEPDDFINVLTLKTGKNNKKKAFAKLLFEDGKLPGDKAENMTAEEMEENPYNRAALISLLCGGDVYPKDIFLINGSDYDEVEKLNLSTADDVITATLSKLGDDGEIIIRLKELYDAATLCELMKGCHRISEAKVDIYNQHKSDLYALKDFINKYAPEKYKEVFKTCKKGLNNYVAYSGNLRWIKDKKAIAEFKTVSSEDFCKYISGIIKNITPDDSDKAFYEDMKLRLELFSFLPKQVNTNNRVIPYQLYYVELCEILRNAKEYLPFLGERDAEGYSAEEKIISIFEFRVPYFVGPIHKDDKIKSNAWIVRKVGRIYPWNFENQVDLDASEDEFIRRMTNKCTYLPGEYVLPKCSLLYSKFCVLNEINNIKIDEEPITVEMKQAIYNELFMRYSRVTVKKIGDFLKSKYGIIGEISGIDVTVKSNLASHLDFKRLLESCTLSEEDVEKIIEHSTYSEDKHRFKKWLTEHYPNLDEKDVNYITSKRYKDFGRLSRKFLSELYGTSVSGGGEAFTIIDMLWSTNDNLMQLLSDKYSYSSSIEKMRKEYYQVNSKTLTERLDEMYVPNGAKRPIKRALEIVSDIEKVMGCHPEKIFIEMARGATEDQKKQGRTKTRLKQLYEFYEQVKHEDVPTLRKELEAMGEQADNKLQSDKLYLYYLQLGKCLYSGKNIELDVLMNGKEYDIDHIYPQCVVKDDSILNNKVLVLSTLNGKKGDKYPLSPEIQANMKDFWKLLNSNVLMTDEKYKRLTRTTPFTDDEKMAFINRQLVETRQSTKAVADLLKEKYPDTEIVYVKAGLVSEFRHEYGILKSRVINDLHHAKDAYLNIVVGNVYDNKFSKKWFKLTDHYDMKTKNIFSLNVKTLSGEVVWSGKDDIGAVKNNYYNNHVHVTRYAFCRKGGLFKQNPVKASSGLVERKRGLDTEKYGGYNETTASFFSLVKYTDVKKTNVMIMPVELLYADKYRKDPDFALSYANKTIKSITGKAPSSVSFPFGDRILRINTVFEFDGIRMCLAAKDSGGKNISFSNISPFICAENSENYIRLVEKFCEKIKKNPSITFDPEYSMITKESNLVIYDLYTKKLGEHPFKLRPANPLDILIKGKDKFISLTEMEQAKCLMNIQTLFSRFSGGCDLEKIGGKPNQSSTRLSSNISNWKKNYKVVRIIDTSASGLFEIKSDNLFDLL